MIDGSIPPLGRNCNDDAQTPFPLTHGSLG